MIYEESLPCQVNGRPQFGCAGGKRWSPCQVWAPQLLFIPWAKFPFMSYLCTAACPRGLRHRHAPLRICKIKAVVALNADVLCNDPRLDLCHGGHRSLREGGKHIIAKKRTTKSMHYPIQNMSLSPVTFLHVVGFGCKCVGDRWTC